MARTTKAVKILNRVEDEAGYTALITELSSDIMKGDRVFVTGGRLDNTITVQDPYSAGALGYTVIKAADNMIVLDLPYTPGPVGDDTYVSRSCCIDAVFAKGDFNDGMFGSATARFGRRRNGQSEARFLGGVWMDGEFVKGSWGGTTPPGYNPATLRTSPNTLKPVKVGNNNDGLSYRVFAAGKFGSNVSTLTNTVWHNGMFEGEEWSGGTWMNGVMDATRKDVRVKWTGGKWVNGIASDVTWDGGTWDGGTFKSVGKPVSGFSVDDPDNPTVLTVYGTDPSWVGDAMLYNTGACQWDNLPLEYTTSGEDSGVHYTVYNIRGTFRPDGTGPSGYGPKSLPESQYTYSYGPHYDVVIPDSQPMISLATFKSGTWNGGALLNASFGAYAVPGSETATWRNGTFNGCWVGGVWENGVLESSRWMSGYWREGLMYGSYWHDGRWVGGMFQFSTVYSCEWLSGTFIGSEAAPGEPGSLLWASGVFHMSKAASGAVWESVEVMGEYEWTSDLSSVQPTAGTSGGLLYKNTGGTVTELVPFTSPQMLTVSQPTAQSNYLKVTLPLPVTSQQGAGYIPLTAGRGVYLEFKQYDPNVPVTATERFYFKVTQEMETALAMGGANYPSQANVYGADNTAGVVVSVPRMELPYEVLTKVDASGLLQVRYKLLTSVPPRTFVAGDFAQSQEIELYWMYNSGTAQSPVMSYLKMFTDPTASKPFLAGGVTYTLVYKLVNIVTGNGFSGSYIEDGLVALTSFSYFAPVNTSLQIERSPKGGHTPYVPGAYFVVTSAQSGQPVTFAHTPASGGVNTPAEVSCGITYNRYSGPVITGPLQYHYEYED